ncbi:MAG TPA: hypothetical protein VH558_01820 [Pseudolabrys sp.]|jgi:hypothetical protein
MYKQIIAAFRKSAVVPLIVGGAIVVAIPTFIFVLIRFVYTLVIRDSLTPAAVKKLDAWRKGQAEFTSLSSMAAFTKNAKKEWLPAAVQQITIALGRLNRRKGV